MLSEAPLATAGDGCQSWVHADRVDQKMTDQDRCRYVVAPPLHGGVAGSAFFLWPMVARRFFYWPPHMLIFFFLSPQFIIRPRLPLIIARIFLLRGTHLRTPFVFTYFWTFTPLLNYSRASRSYSPRRLVCPRGLSRRTALTFFYRLRSLIPFFWSDKFNGFSHRHLVLFFCIQHGGGFSRSLLVIRRKVFLLAHLPRYIGTLVVI